MDAKRRPEVVTVDFTQVVSSKVCSFASYISVFNLFPRHLHIVLAPDCRNNMFIYLHILLEVAVYAEFTYEVFGFCREMDTGLISLCVPYILLAAKTFFFYLCITRDPGWFS